MYVYLFPRLCGDSHLVNAGSGPVSQGLPSGLVLHQPAGSQERASSDHLLIIRLKTAVRVLFYHRAGHCKDKVLQNYQLNRRRIYILDWIVLKVELKLVGNHRNHNQ